MVFQDYALWPHMTVAENVGFAVRRLGLGAAQRRQRALAMLERVGLADQGAKYPNQLSGGQQQRVALARALVAGTPLLLCDEPLSNLDAHLREQVRVEIATLTRDSGATVVYITHDQQEAFALADEVAVIHQGRILQSGPPEEVYRHPANRFVAQFTGLAGTVSGEVVGRRADGIVLVRTGRATVEAIAVGDQEVGTPVDMLLRADALSFGAPETDRGGLEGG
jgi:ABC-type Fe3+/spermidine/putrescine transport system ATPase subunit